MSINPYLYSVRPKVLICDESVSALDVSVQAQVLNLLNHLKKKLKLTYIFISHDLSIVKYMSDKIVVMKEGVFKEIGFSEDIYGLIVNDITNDILAKMS